MDNSYKEMATHAFSHKSMTTAKKGLNEYNTSELSEAAYLLTKGCRDYRIMWTGQKAIFTFVAEEVYLESLLKKYFEGKALVNPRDFFMNLQNVKSLIYAQKIRRLKEEGSRNPSL